MLVAREKHASDAATVYYRNLHVALLPETGSRINLTSFDKHATDGIEGFYSLRAIGLALENAMQVTKYRAIQKA